MLWADADAALLGPAATWHAPYCRSGTKVVGRPRAVTFLCRAAYVFRFEDGDWKISTAQADPLARFVGPSVIYGLLQMPQPLQRLKLLAIVLRQLESG
jgi:hypothetical protein